MLTETHEYRVVKADTSSWVQNIWLSQSLPDIRVKFKITINGKSPTQSQAFNPDGCRNNGISSRNEDLEVQQPRLATTSSPFDGVPAWGLTNLSESSDAEHSTASLSDDSASLVAHQGMPPIQALLVSYFTSLSINKQPSSFAPLQYLYLYLASSNRRHWKLERGTGSLLVVYIEACL